MNQRPEGLDSWMGEISGLLISDNVSLILGSEQDYIGNGSQFYPYEKVGPNTQMSQSVVVSYLCPSPGPLSGSVF